MNNIANLFEEDDDLAWLKNTILFYPFILKRVLKGARIDILQQYIPKGEEYHSHLNKDDIPQIFDQDVVINNGIKIELTKEGKEVADEVAELMLGFPIENVGLIMEFADDAYDKKQYKDAVRYYKLAGEKGNQKAIEALKQLNLK